MTMVMHILYMMVFHILGHLIFVFLHLLEIYLLMELTGIKYIAEPEATAVFDKVPP